MHVNDILHPVQANVRAQTDGVTGERLKGVYDAGAVDRVGQRDGRVSKIRADVEQHVAWAD